MRWSASVSIGSCCQAPWPGSDPWHPYGDMSEKGIPVSSPLTPTCAVTCEYTLTPLHAHKCLENPLSILKQHAGFSTGNVRWFPKPVWEVGSQSRKNKTEFSFLSCRFRNNTWDLLLKYTNWYLNCLVHLYTEKKDFFGQAQAPQNSLWPLQIKFCWLGSPKAEVPGLVPLTGDGLFSWLWSVWLCPHMDF